MRIGDKVIDNLEGDVGVITRPYHRNDDTSLHQVGWWIRWETGCCAGEELWASFSDISRATNPDKDVVEYVKNLRDELTARAFDTNGNVKDSTLAEVVWKINSCLYSEYPKKS